MTYVRELDWKSHDILVVDDEEDNLDAFRFSFRKSFTLHYALGGQAALDMLERIDPAVIVSDQRMPGMSGIEFLKKAKARRPDVVGILLTAYADLGVLIDAVNSGAVERYVQKPWDSKELTVILRQAMVSFATVRENRRLREQGEGDGMVVRRGFQRPPTFHRGELRKAKVGYLFEVITKGLGVMPSYAVQVPAPDRWAIVAYVRALQKSHAATLDEVPEPYRAKLLATQGGSP